MSVSHVHHVAQASQLELHDQGLKVRQSTMAKNLLVCHVVFPENIQEYAKAAEMELIQLLVVATVAGPCFTAIEK